MNPQQQFCPNEACCARGKVGAGNIGVHSWKERRYICHRCKKTFSETKGTALYGIKKEHDLFVVVITLLAHGCPTRAIMAAFGLARDTVQDWMEKAGLHCQEVHEHFMEETELDLGQVQADEIKVKVQGGWVWLAQAIMVSTRLWLGGAVSPKRNKQLIRNLAGQVKRWALCRPILIAVDGFSAYVKVFRQTFRTPLKDRPGPGRPRLWEWEEVNIVQVVKQRQQKTLTITRRIAQGCADQIDRLVQASQGQAGSYNTSYIERLNGTFRQRLACLARRSRAQARAPQTVEWGMYLVGCVYNFCTYQHSLRLPLWITERRIHWVKRTPAVAAGLTDHCWSVAELLSFKVPPPPFMPPKRRGRPPKITGLEAIS